MAFRWPQHKISSAPLDYSVDWRRWLGSKTIASVAWTINAGNGVESFEPGATVRSLVSVAKTNTPTVATIFIEGGSNNIDYRIFCTITTNDSSTETREINIRTKI